MGDDEAGAVLAQLHHGLLDQQLCAGVDRGGGLVQDEDVAAGQEGPRDGQQLLLTGGHARAGVVDHRVVALRQGADDVVGAGGPRGGEHVVVGGARSAEGDVLLDGAFEEPGLLQDHADLLAQLITVQVARVHAVQGDRSGLGVVEAQEEVDQGGLACPRGPHDGDALPRLDHQVEIRDELGSRGVGETHVVEDDAALDLGGQVGGARLGLLWGVHELEEPLGAGRAGLQQVRHGGQLGDRLAEVLGVLDEGLDVPQGHGAAGDPQPADDRDDDEVEVGDDPHDRLNGAGDPLGPVGALVEAVVLLGEQPLEGALSVEQRHDLVAGEGLLHDARHLPGGVPLLGEVRARAPRDEGGGADGHRDRRQRHQGELAGDRDHHGGHADDGDQRVEGLRDRLLEGLGDVVDVVGDAGEHVAARALIDVGDRDARELVLHLGAQALGGALHHPCQDQTLDPHDEGGGDVERGDLGQDDGQATRVQPGPDRDVHAAHHGGVGLVPLLAQQGDEPLAPGARGQSLVREQLAHDALVDDVGGPPEHPRSQDVEEDGGGGHDDNCDDPGALGAQLPYQAPPGAARVLGHDGRGALVGAGSLAHAASSALICDRTISW